MLLSANTKAGLIITSKRGYDLVKERKAWYERIKARGGKI